MVKLKTVILATVLLCLLALSLWYFFHPPCDYRRIGSSYGCDDMCNTCWCHFFAIESTVVHCEFDVEYVPLGERKFLDLIKEDTKLLLEHRVLNLTHNSSDYMYIGLQNTLNDALNFTILIGPPYWALGKNDSILLGYQWGRHQLDPGEKKVLGMQILGTNRSYNTTLRVNVSYYNMSNVSYIQGPKIVLYAVSNLTFNII